MRYFGSLWSTAAVSVAPLRAYSLLSSGFAAHGAYLAKRTASLPTPLGVGSVAFSGLGEQNPFIGNNCGPYSASRRGACYFSRGMLRRAALLLAPSIAASLPPPKPCGFTKQDLMGLMEKVFQKEVGYDMYFFKNAEAEANEFTIHSDLKKAVDRCKKCGLAIDEHRDAAVTKLEPTLEDLILRMNAVGTTPSSRIASGKLKDLIAGAANSVLRGVPYVKSETARQIFDTHMKDVADLGNLCRLYSEGKAESNPTPDSTAAERNPKIDPTASLRAVSRAVACTTPKANETPVPPSRALLWQWITLPKLCPPQHRPPPTSGRSLRMRCAPSWRTTPAVTKGEEFA